MVEQKEVKRIKTVIVICGDCGAENHAAESGVQNDGSILGTVYHNKERGKSTDGKGPSEKTGQKPGDGTGEEDKDQWPF